MTDAPDKQKARDAHKGPKETFTSCGYMKTKERLFFAQILRNDVLPMLRSNSARCIDRNPYLHPIMLVLQEQAKLREAECEKEQEAERLKLVGEWATAFARLITARRLAVSENEATSAHRVVVYEDAQTGFAVEEDHVVPKVYPLMNLVVDLGSSKTTPSLNVSFYDTTKETIVTETAVFHRPSNSFIIGDGMKRSLDVRAPIKGKLSLSFLAAKCLGMNWRNLDLKSRKHMVPVMLDLESAPKRPLGVAEEDDDSDMPPLKRRRVEI